MEYRINYGNGQVSHTYKSYAEVKRELLSERGRQYDTYFRIQRYDGGSADDPGAWVGIGKAGRLSTLDREGI